MSAVTVQLPLEPKPGRAATRLTDPMNSLDIQVDYSGAVPTAVLTGELDGASVAAIESLADDFAAQGAFKLVLDLRRLFTANLAGLAALRDAALLLQECGGVLALAAPRPRMRYLLSHTGVVDEFAVYKTVNEAVCALAEHGATDLREFAADLRRPIDPPTRPVVPALVSALSKR